MFTQKFQYNHQLKTYSRRLRKNQTETEKFLWNRLRARQLKGCKFHRQFPLDQYILDFYCPEKKLAVELDGGQHLSDKQMSYDEKRTFCFKSRGIKIIRFFDNEVFRNIDGVLEKILEDLT